MEKTLDDVSNDVKDITGKLKESSSTEMFGDDSSSTEMFGSSIEMFGDNNNSTEILSSGTEMFGDDNSSAKKFDDASSGIKEVVSSKSSSVCDEVTGEESSNTNEDEKPHEEVKNANAQLDSE